MEHLREFKEEEADESPVVKRSPDSLHVFTMDELMSATSNFSEENLLGEGLYGTIYKGTVEGKHMVAITKFTCANWPVGSFSCVIDQPALQYLGTMRHPHLVRLLGYCDQGEHNILIHEYMPRGSLKYHLLETNLIGSLPWLTRLNIAVGAAKGLSVLHESRKQMMFYTRFTASSILLASDYTAKLWGFGLAMENDVTVSDGKTREVYEFGVVLLELLAGRPCLDEKRHDRKRNLVEWFQRYVFGTEPGQSDFHDVCLKHIMDPSLEWRYSVRAAWRTAEIAGRCLGRVLEDRPSMQDVVQALEPLLSDDMNDGPAIR